MRVEILSYVQKSKSCFFATVRVYPSWWRELIYKEKPEEHELFSEDFGTWWHYTDTGKLVFLTNQDDVVRESLKKHRDELSAKELVKRRQERIEEARSKVYSP